MRYSEFKKQAVLNELLPFAGTAMNLFGNKKQPPTPQPKQQNSIKPVASKPAAPKAETQPQAVQKGTDTANTPAAGAQTTGSTDTGSAAPANNQQTVTKKVTTKPDGTTTEETTQPVGTIPSVNFNAPDKVEDTPFKTKEAYYEQQILDFFKNNPGLKAAVDAQTGGKSSPIATGASVVGKGVDFINGLTGKETNNADQYKAGVDFLGLDAQGRANVISTLLQDQATEKALLDALEKGDMDMWQMLIGLKADGTPDPNAKPDLNAEAMKIVWKNMDPKQQERFMDAGKKAAWAGIKQDFWTNLPKAVSLWFKMRGWDQMGEFAQDPLKFYLSLAGILGGGLVLGGAVLGGGGSEQQPVVVNNGSQQNPYYSGTL